MLPDAVQVADPFHVIKLANTKLDECRRRVQNETLGHRGHKADPLYRCRRLLTKAEERLSEGGKEKLMGCPGNCLPLVRSGSTTCEDAARIVGNSG
jgi:transposase